MSPKIRSKHADMMKRYFSDGWSVGAVAKAYQRSPALVKKLIDRDKRLGRVRAKTGGSPDPRLKENRRPLSFVHSRLGILVSRHRQREHLGMTDFGLRVGLSRVRVSEIESGSFDLTLCDVVSISRELGLSPIDLISEKSNVPSVQRQR